MRVLVLNPGSSSLKASVIEPDASRAGDSIEPLAGLDVDWGSDATRGGDPVGGLRALVGRLAEAGVPESSLGAVGYRVVHGGTRFREPVLIDPAVLDEIRELRELAPLHNGVAADTIAAGLRAMPGLPHVATFDTAFHATLDEPAYRYPVPERWLDEFGVRRYGFHGLSVAWSTTRAAELLARPVADLRLVVAHLGSGCSVTAISGGRSVDTSMGMTPLEGLMMGTRAGSIDPGILLDLLRDGKRSLEELADDLDHGSGLLGVSGRTSDVRELARLADGGEQRSALALTMFERRAAQWIGAAATSLDRLDALVFTGGIGENAASVRARIVGRLAPLGIEPIGTEPVRSDAVLSAARAQTAVLRIEAREDIVIARAVAELLASR